MTRPRKATPGATLPSDLDAALEALSADALRGVVRDLLLELDDRAHARVVDSLVHRAARSGSGWAPAPISDAQVTEVLTFVDSAKRVGQADPSEVDALLRRGSAAFLRKDYAATHRIFGALLPPLGEGEIDLGQHELVDEVLGTDPAECAVQYAVSAYMIAPPPERSSALLAAIEEVHGVGHFWEPLRQIERVAVEPLPGFEEFLPRWRALIAGDAAGARRNDWDTERDRWLREVVRRLDGAEGLAELARSTRRADDLRAWCSALTDAGDWKGALTAFEEAAHLVAKDAYTRGDFFDGAALAAQCLGRRDLPARLEQAWRAGPSSLRLRRWLGASASKAVLEKHVSQAIESCPKQAASQRALLLVLARDFQPAAKLLATAPGLGWSSDEHPGHLLFPLFARLLGGQRPLPSTAAAPLSHLEAELDEHGELTAHRDAPRLAAPTVEPLLDLAGIDAAPDAAARATILAAMKRSAEHRIAGVTEQKRRRQYGHAAQLVAACVACDGTSDAVRWAAALQANHRRFPALRDELERALKAP